ncbi:DUF2314 domain-containing protein [Bremerella alba]|uniref:DUF2314 domain-containing protein n=1 Tax=Bremerella alba TaxID=980252 RepID=A0A7V9A7Y6_9BACT|nr:DUF2314 domain-containing protein [Bremerella alba]MBA2115748.1 hypothetical protein [Bremerella alba]
MRALFPIMLLFLLILGCSAQSGTPSPHDRDQQGSANSAEEATSTIDQFIAALDSDDGQDFAVKTSIDDDGRTESFWVTGVTFDSGQFTGTVEGDAALVSSIQTGQAWTVSEGDVLDWKYLRNGKIYGNYSEPAQNGSSP